MKRLLIIFLLMFGMSLVFADCDMMAMIAKEGYTISQFGDDSGSYQYPYDFFQFLINRSHNDPNNKRNDDGYGVVYYPLDGSFYYNPNNLYDPDNQAWYKISQDLNGNWHYGYNGWTWYGDPNHYWLNDEPLDIARDLILNIGSQDCEATIVLGHDRQGTGGSGNHPFRLEYNGQIFAFMQNGGIEDGTTGNPDEPNIKEVLFDELNNANWFDDYDSNWEGESNDVCSWIDSEIFFHWIMKNIDDKNGCIIEGIHQAVTKTVFDDDQPVSLADVFSDPYSTRYDWVNCINFVLSDGNNLYVFKNGEDLHHTLYLQTDLEGFYSVNTFILPANNTELNQFDFVKISKDEDPIVYQDFLNIDVKTFSSGIEWVSFPYLDLLENEQYEQAYYEDGNSGLLQETYQGDPTIDGFIRINGKDKDIQYDGENFIDETGFNNMLFRHEGYKVEVSSGADQTIFAIDGDRLESYSLDMTAMEYYWLGYYIPYSQNIEVAFGEDFWPDVNKVWAEDWFYDKMNNNRGIGEPELPANSTTGKTLEYGKMYIVQMYRDADDFSWDDSNAAEEPEKKQEAENFSYTEKTDYEAIDIMDIPENVTEIGVFEEDVCVGAVVVNNSCEQVLAYTTNANREQIPITFELMVGSRGITSSVKDYKVMNQLTGQFEPNVIIAGRQDYSAITLGEYNENLTPEISKVQLHNNYPNPFNPETNISFSIPEEQKIQLSIYNLKGQKVKELINGQFVSGKHSIVWNGTDDSGKQVGSGLYFYKLKTSDHEYSKKMLLLQ